MTWDSRSWIPTGSCVREAAEVIYGAGKTPQQIAGIVEAMKKSGTGDDP